MSEEKDVMLQIPKSIVELHWALSNTREWPLSMLADLATVKKAYHQAIESQTPSKEPSNDSEIPGSDADGDKS